MRKPATKRAGQTKAPVSGPPLDAPMPFMPLSEDPHKIRHATRDECIDIIRGMAKRDPTRHITRNYFRVHSPLAESAWNRHFGTFHEYRRQAGIVLSRHQHRLERAIAKHASVDRMRAVTQEVNGYAHHYDRPSSRRFKTTLVGADFHDKNCDSFFLHCWLDTARRVQPDNIVFDGDLFDLPEFGKYDVDPRTWDPVGRIKAGHAILEQTREAAPEAEITLVEGNHEFRLLRHFAERSPALQVVLSDLHGWTVDRLLGLPQFEVNFIANADLGAFSEKDIKRELGKNWLMLHDAVLFHHFPEGKAKGVPGCNGHHHQHEVWSMHNETYGQYEWHQLGCGHQLHAAYCDASHWGMGFMLVHTDTQSKRSAFEYFEVKPEFAVIGGQYYLRADLGL